MRDIIIVGIQGSGKGTQVQRLVDHFDFHPIQTGKFFRSLENDQSPTARQIKNLIDKGEMVPDDIVMKFVEDEINDISDPDTPIIYDGVPRTESQRVMLEEILSRKGREFHVIHILLGDDQARRRLTARAQLENRADDHGQAVDRRINAYHQNTEPMVAAWKKMDRVTQVSGSGSIEDVSYSIDEALKFIGKDF